MKKTIKIGLYLGLLLALPVWAAAQQPLISEQVFRDPSPEFGIRCFWWWLNGNTDKETITHDLTEMKAKGFSGAIIFDAGGADQGGNRQVPEGPMFGSTEWRELYLHAVQEANRLGLELSLSIQSGWNLGGPDITAEEAAKQVTFSETVVRGPGKIRSRLNQPRTRIGYYRHIATLALPTRSFPGRKPLGKIEDKAAEREAGGSVPDTRHLLRDIPGEPGEEDARLGEVINVSAFVHDGVLDWEAPPGTWTVLQIGYTPTVAHVSTYSGKWTGYVIDYLSEKHFNRYWDTHVEPLMKMIGPMAGKTLRYLHTDSFEAGGMNWTEGFEKEFRARRGYDPIPYLPVIARKLIESREHSTRFLNDFRKTLGDLIAEKHYGTFAKRAAAYGMGLQAESAGPHAGPFDGLRNYSYNELVLSEFWSPSPHRARPNERFFVKQAGSAAKIFNKKLVGAESFTTIGPHWNDVIWSDMKPSVDHEFCAGLNMVFLHTYTSSPKEMGLPGQEYFAGTHFNSNVTWWQYSTEFIRYLRRCQYLLRKGTTQADVLYYYGDHIPNLGGYKESDPAGAVPGYDYDLINEDRLLALEVSGNRLTLPHGVSYRVLVLPDHRILSLKAMEKIHGLVQKGALVIGTKPETTASLAGGNEAETRFKALAADLWGEGGGRTGSRRFGSGQIVWGKTAREVLRSGGVYPDLEVVNKRDGAVFDYVHRTADDTEIYFLSSQNRDAEQMTAVFRVTGKQPELWNAVTGEVKNLTHFTQEDGRTTLPLTFDPYGSAFVIFRKPIASGKQGRKGPEPATFTRLRELTGSWEVGFDTAWGGPQKVVFDQLVSWTDRTEEGIRYYSGKAVYRKTFTLGKQDVRSGDLLLDLGEVKDVGIARVTLNGTDLGIVWCPPFRVPLSASARAGVNTLQVEVINSWRNRLVGDRDKSKEERRTRTNITLKKEWETLPSGLLGPVVIGRITH